MIDIINELDRYGVEDNTQRFQREDYGDEAWYYLGSELGALNMKSNLIRMPILSKARHAPRSLLHSESHHRHFESINFAVIWDRSLNRR